MALQILMPTATATATVSVTPFSSKGYGSFGGWNNNNNNNNNNINNIRIIYKRADVTSLASKYTYSTKRCVGPDGNLPQKLRNIEPHLIESILNEIMDEDSNVRWDDIGWTKKKTKKDKASSKNSGAPKRPPTGFLVFMKEFRKDFKENFPDNKSVSVVYKEGRVKWKAMSESEKAPYVAKAATKKADYGIAMKQHNYDLNGTEKEKSSSTSKSSVDTNDDVKPEVDGT